MREVTDFNRGGLLKEVAGSTSRSAAFTNRLTYGVQKDVEHRRRRRAVVVGDSLFDAGVGGNWPECDIRPESLNAGRAERNTHVGAHQG